MRIQNRLPWCLLAFSLPLAMFGCASNPVPTASPTTATQSDASDAPSKLAAQFKAIDDNPHMPPAVKDAYKANLIQAQHINHNIVAKPSSSSK
jgi:hypothetical protein